LWEKKISSPIAVGILEQLFYTPTVSIPQVAKRFNVSYQVASTIVAQLKKVQILRETTGRKRDKRYVYSDYLDILAEGTKI
jgi:transposase